MLFTRRDLAALIIPLIIEQLLAITIGMADTMMVASVGEAAVSAVSLVDSINILLINIFSALATGGAVIASQYLGRNDEGTACLAAKQLTYAVTALSGLFMLFSIVFRTSLLRLLFGAIDEEVMEGAKIYFLLSAISYPFLGLYNAGAALFRAMGNSKVSMLTSILMNGLNIIGNAILIFVFHMGVTGAAAATLASRIIGAVLMGVLICNKKNPIHIDAIFKYRPDFTLVKNILRIGIPNGLENGMFQLGRLLVQSLIASFGTAAIAANAVGNNLASMQTLPGTAIGLAIITVVGRCIGAKSKEQAKHYTVTLMALTHICILVASLTIAVLSKPLISLYGLSGETSAIAFELIMLFSVACVIFWPSSFALPNSFRAASDARYPMIISIISMWTCRIGLSYVFGGWMGMGVLGVWIAMVCDWIFRGIFFVVRYFRGKWLTKYQEDRLSSSAEA